MAKAKKNAALEKYPLEYEEPTEPRPPARPKTTPRKPTKDTFKVRKVLEMAKEAKTQKKYAPSRMEVAKTVVIAVLVTAVIAFIAGTSYEKSHQAEIQGAVHAAVQSAQASK